MNALDRYNQEINQKADKSMEILLLAYFGFGIVLSFFYDTWLVAFGVGAISLGLYYGTKSIFKGQTIHHYVAGSVLAIFMAQFIYQMHGLFEMHFTAFIAIVALINYQNWRVYIPLTLTVVVHHSTFAYIQYLGYANDVESYRNIYFTQLEYMDFQTFLFHAGLFAVAVVLAGIHSFNLEVETKNKAQNIDDLEQQQALTLKNIDFANEIAQGNFENNYEVAEDDNLGHALSNMRNSLVEGAEREEQDRFLNVGIAKISEIIRNNGDNLNELAYDAISFLVKYMDANQGGTFILNQENDERVLELRGCYAYNRQKFLEKTIKPGEGLVGQCFLEKEPIYMTDIPQDYVYITSGLGDATPGSLVLVPLKSNEVVEGVIELASFNTLDKFHIEFLEKVGENLASAISSVRISEETQRLYSESQIQSEQLQTAEEEMRQNMEELEATQEEMQRYANEMENRLKAIDGSGIATVEFDIDGTVTKANKSFLDLMKYSEGEVIGQHHKMFVDPTYAKSKEYKKFWDDLSSGKSVQGEFSRVAKDGSEVFIHGSYTTLKDVNGVPTSVIKYATDISEFKNNTDKSSGNGAVRSKTKLS